MTNEQLIALLQSDEVLPVVIHTRIKTGYDEGDIYESVEVGVSRRNGKIVLEAAGQTLVGGW